MSISRTIEAQIPAGVWPIAREGLGKLQNIYAPYVKRIQRWKDGRTFITLQGHPGPRFADAEREFGRLLATVDHCAELRLWMSPDGHAVETM